MSIMTIELVCVACGEVYQSHPSGGLCHKCGNMSFLEQPTGTVAKKPESVTPAAEPEAVAAEKKRDTVPPAKTQKKRRR